MASPSNAVGRLGSSSCNTGLLSGSSQALPFGGDCGALVCAAAARFGAGELAGAAGAGIVCITVVSKIAGLGFASAFSSGRLLGTGVRSGMGLTACGVAGLGAAGTGVGGAAGVAGATFAGAAAAGAGAAG